MQLSPAWRIRFTLLRGGCASLKLKLTENFYADHSEVPFSVTILISHIVRLQQYD